MPFLTAFLRKNSGTKLQKERNRLYYPASVPELLRQTIHLEQGMVMKILLAGHGSIGRAFEAIYRERQCPDELTVCDLRNGENCLDLIRNNPGK